MSLPSVGLGLVLTVCDRYQPRRQCRSNAPLRSPAGGSSYGTRNGPRQVGKETSQVEDVRLTIEIVLGQLPDPRLRGWGIPRYRGSG
jgi:hypothetical protein